MSKRTRRTFSPEFGLETAQLVVEQSYTHDEAAKALGVGFSTIGKWVVGLHGHPLDYMDIHWITWTSIVNIVKWPQIFD